MKLEDYISEAVSGKRSHSGHYNSGKEITDKTPFDVACSVIENFGITWTPRIKWNDSVNISFTLDAIDSWNFQYDEIDFLIGVTLLMIVTHRRCYKLYWNTNRKDLGPVEGTLTKRNGTRLEVITSDLNEVLDELNTELSTMI